MAALCSRGRSGSTSPACLPAFEKQQGIDSIEALRPKCCLLLPSFLWSILPSLGFWAAAAAPHWPVRQRSRSSGALRPWGQSFAVSFLPSVGPSFLRTLPSFSIGNIAASRPRCLSVGFSSVVQFDWKQGPQGRRRFDFRLRLVLLVVGVCLRYLVRNIFSFWCIFGALMVFFQLPLAYSYTLTP